MIDTVAARLKELTVLRAQLLEPSCYGNPTESAKVARAIRRLEPLERLYQEYRKAEQVIADEANFASDPELGPVAREEAATARASLPALLDGMKRQLIPADPDDERSVIVEVRAGAGGQEAALFAAEQLRMYLKYAETKGWKTELLDTSHADAGGIKEASARIEGEGVYGELKYESGVHRVQRIPATEAKGRIHTSTTTVAILPEAEEVDIVIRPEDLRIDTYRSGGAGGQHVNKTESAVRITHVPTGTVVACQTERSQLKNRALAMSVLRSRLYAADQEKKAKERGDLRSGQVGTGDRSEKIRTYNVPQDRVTDHRIGESFSNLPGILEGNLGAIIETLRRRAEEEKLKRLAVS